MVPIEAKNLKLPVLQDHKFREFEAILYYVRGFEAKKQAVQLHWLHWLEWRPCG